MEKPNYNHLYYFYIVAREGSIKAAADKLHVSQPTISDQIKLLEEFFQTKLFERRNRSLVLTKAGKLATQYAQNIFDQGQELTMRLRNKLQLPKSSIDIGITQHMSHFFLYDSLLPLLETGEAVVKITEQPRHLLLAELEEEKLDLIFSDSNEGLSQSMNAYRFGVNKTYVLAHKQFRKYKKSFPESLGELPCMQYTSDSQLRYEIELYFAKYGLAPKVIGEADDIELLQLVCERGLGFIIVPEVAKKRMLQNKDLMVLGELAELQTTIWCISKKSYDGVGQTLLK
ncbi:MAG: hypothetical protein CME62_12640 [Halobacteriovoraceae bacterium]|nr:hypothetical protein [Halobacteriovoraceae bacterium]|tara:strand:- start:22245 stop:23102 length:858 start_codon:yes stop_codon:yes gene_type:complete